MLKPIAVTDEHAGHCEHCDAAIKRAVVLKDTDTGRFWRYGVRCAANATGHTQAKVRRLAFNSMYEQQLKMGNPPTGFRSWHEVDAAIYPIE